MSRAAFSRIGFRVAGWVVLVALVWVAVGMLLNW